MNQASHLIRRAFLGACIITVIGIVMSACQTGATSTTGNVNVKLKCNFIKDASGKDKSDAAKNNACPTPAPSEDTPDLTAGLDCDSDGGVVRYITPTRYRIAVKRLSLIRADGTKVDILADTGTLSSAQVIDLTDVFTLDPSSIAAGVYPQYEVEIYYVELTMPMYGTPQVIRVYLSDDDFPSEGSKGHHQGDVAVIGGDGSELGLFTPGQKWQTGFLQAASTNALRPGSTDAQTGHQRGQFGDATLWNQTLFQQGASQDVFIWQGELGLQASATSATITFSFNVKDCWFYEDFDNNQDFNPCDPAPGDACAANAAWAPLIAKPDVVVE